jgi:hypothetical protein
MCTLCLYIHTWYVLVSRLLYAHSWHSLASTRTLCALLASLHSVHTSAWKLTHNTKCPNTRAYPSFHQEHMAQLPRPSTRPIATPLSAISLTARWTFVARSRSSTFSKKRASIHTSLASKRRRLHSRLPRQKTAHQTCAKRR